jgi:hypothetical protein
MSAESTVVLRIPVLLNIETPGDLTSPNAGKMTVVFLAFGQMMRTEFASTVVNSAKILTAFAITRSVFALEIRVESSASDPLTTLIDAWKREGR